MNPSSDHMDIIRSEAGLAADVRAMIEQTREAVARTVNAGMTLLYWRVGRRIQVEILKNQRAEYGGEILATLSQELTAEFGKGFSYSSLTRMLRFAENFPEASIVATLSRQLGWSHFKEIISLKDELQRDFYAEMCRVERWSVRTLRAKIDSMLFERTAISKKPEELARAELAALRGEDKLTPDLVFRDPYLLDFLGLKDRYLEKDLEDAILRELETFLLELGCGFAFLGRQTRIQIDSDDFYLDLLFYHRGLKRLIAIDLKIGDFKAEYKGQMELYPVRYERTELPLCVCPAKRQRRSILHRIYQRSSSSTPRARKRTSRIDKETPTGGTRLLRGVPLTSRRHKTGKVFEISLGEALHQEPIGRLSHGVNLRWLAKHEQQPGEGPPLGLILCAGKKTEQIELLELDQSGIHVAEYLTALPPRELLQQKLHAAIEISRARLEARKED